MVARWNRQICERIEAALCKIALCIIIAFSPRELSEQIARSEQTLVKLDKQLDLKLVKFIHAQKMSLALSRVLSKSPGVEVESLTTLPVTVFNASENTEQLAKNIFYKHTLEIKLVGNYNAIYRYFLNLEALQDKF